MASTDCWNEARIKAFAAQASDDYTRYGRDCPSFCSCVCSKLPVVGGAARLELRVVAVAAALLAVLRMF